jgi:hypothetical protein
VLEPLPLTVVTFNMRSVADFRQRRDMIGDLAHRSQRII